MIAIFIDERGRSVQPKGPQRRDRHRHLISKAACHLNSARWLRLERPSSCRVGIPVGREIDAARLRSEEHTSELQSLMRSSYAVFCLKKKTSKCHQYLITDVDIDSHSPADEHINDR